MYFTHLTTALFIMMLISCNKPAKREDANIDTIFIKWNSATIASLKGHLKSPTETEEGKVYENRLEAFMSLMEIDNEYSVNKKSIRYKFLQELITDNDRNLFYIIEANTSGEQVSICNYVIDFSNSTAIVDRYNYIDGKWFKKSSSTQAAFKNAETLIGYKTEFGKGFNQDDVIITRFDGSEVKDSEFFLYSTLSDFGNLRRVITP